MDCASPDSHDPARIAFDTIGLTLASDMASRAKLG